MDLLVGKLAILRVRSEGRLDQVAGDNRVSLWGEAMPKYVIERNVPGAGNLTPEEVKGISQKSCQVLTGMGPQIQWVESFVTQDKIYCVYIAPNEAEVLEHARQGGFPADSVSEVKQMIDPTTAE